MSHLNRPIKGYKGGYIGGQADMSLDFSTSATSSLKTSSDAVLGFSSNFTMMAWTKRSTATGDGVIMSVTQPASTVSLELINFGSTFRSTFIDSLARAKQRTWTSGGLNAWTQLVVVNDASANIVYPYTDGAAGTGVVVGADDFLSLPNTSRDIFVGLNATSSAFNGLIYQTAIWFARLSAAEVAAIYNGGDGSFDLSVDSGDYVSSSLLRHWYRTGHEATPNLGADYGNGTLVNLDTVTDLTNANRSSDIPT